MRPKASRSIHCLIAVLSVTLLSPGHRVALAQETQPQSAAPAVGATPAEAAPKISNDELDALVAPIALYPDPLLAQTLAASTYPLEIIQLQQWMQKNKTLKGKALADAVAKLPYDPSVQSMAGVPDALQRMAANISWTTDMGNAFLAQQSDVMEAVQRMRAKAQSKGTLKTSQQQVVETKPVEGGKQVIVIEQSSPDVVYVPSYDPTVVYGSIGYPYYPYSYPGYVAGMGLAFGTGLALGAAWNNNWGNCNWGGGDLNINHNNNFNRNTNVNRGQGGNNWKHNAQHRGSAPYGDRATANRYGGNARQRQSGASNRPGGGAGMANRPGGGAGMANRPGGGAGMDRPGGGGAGIANRPGGGAGASRPGGGGAGVGSGGNRASTRPSGGGADRIGSRDLGGSSNFASRGGGGGGSRDFSSRGGGGGGGFGGGGGGFSSGGGGRATHMSSSRGGRSMGGGGMSRGGGGGRGGGGRGGGGGRR